jgi:hypothetical protein
MKKFKVGDIVAIPKTKGVGDTYEKSAILTKAREKNQDYLVITGVESYYYKADTALSHTGDFFLEQDLEFYSSNNLGMITVSKEDLKKIHDIACNDWKGQIIEYANSNPFGNYVELTVGEIDAMFKAATKDQLPVLEEIFGKREDKLNFSGKLITDEVDGIKIFGNSDDWTTSAFIGLPKEVPNVFYLNPEYNWDLDGYKLKITRK